MRSLRAGSSHCRHYCEGYNAPKTITNSPRNSGPTCTPSECGEKSSQPKRSHERHGST